MLLSKVFKVSYFRISSLQVPIHDLSFRRSPALPPPRLQAPSSRLPSSTLSSTLSSTHRLVESGPTPARRHWAASPRVSVPGARHTNHGTRITERDAVERHLGADPFRVRELALRPRPRGCNDLQFQRTRSGTRSRSACTRPHLFVAEAQKHLTTAVGSGRRYRAPSLLCRKRVDDALSTFCGVYHGPKKISWCLDSLCY